MLNGVLNWDDSTMIQVLKLLCLQNLIKPSQAGSGLTPRRGLLRKKVPLAYPHCCMNLKIIPFATCTLFIGNLCFKTLKFSCVIKDIGTILNCLWTLYQSANKPIAATAVGIGCMSRNTK